MRRVFCLFFILLAPCLSLPQLSQGQERMRIAWAGSTPSNTPIWVADQKGFFKKNGLNAEVIAISASTIVIQALLTGEVDFIIAPSATLVTSRDEHPVVAPHGGTIVEWLVEDGDPVAPGQPIIRLHPEAV